MALYNLPYKYELAYVHVNGKVAFNLGKPLKDINSQFDVIFKRDTRFTPGLICTQWTNTSGASPYNCQTQSTYSSLTWNKAGNVEVEPTLTDAAYMLRRGWKADGEAINPETGLKYNARLDPYSGKRYNMYCGDGRHRFIGYYGRVYLKRGETLQIVGGFDDMKYLKFDTTVVWKTSDKSEWTIDWTYTATSDAYHDFTIICANRTGDGGFGYTDVVSGFSPAGVGMRFNGGELTEIGNASLSEPRFFVPGNYYGTEYIYGDTASSPRNQATYIETSTTKRVSLGYGNKTKMMTGQALEGKSRITYKGGLVYLHERLLASLAPTLFNATNISIGSRTLTPETIKGFRGNLYGARLINYTNNYADRNDYYFVMANDNTIKLFNLSTKELIDPTYIDTTGVLEAGPACHDHDDYFLAGTVLGEIPGDAMILTATDAYYSYKVVDSLPDPNTTKDMVVILSQASGGFSEGQVLIRTKSTYSASYTWKALSAPTEGVAPPSAVKSHKIGYKVWIRWDDPGDATDDTGVVLRKWKYTRLVRKVGSAPINAYDGKLVVDNQVRNAYASNHLIDDLPPNVNGVWYYRLFAFSEDGVVSTSTACTFSPVEFDWRQMSTYIQDGRGPSIFGIGDVIQLDGIVPDPGYGFSNLEFMVAGFDQATPASKRTRHSITLVSRYCPQVGTSNANGFVDVKWTNYRRVDNEIVVEGLKQYYVKTAYGTYELAVPQPMTGTTIHEEDGYYELIMDSRAQYGSNRWSTSALRKWMNAVNTEYYIQSEDRTVNPTKTYYQKDSDGVYVPITPRTGADPALDGYRERGANIEFLTSMMPPLRAIRELDMEKQAYNPGTGAYVPGTYFDESVQYYTKSGSVYVKADVVKATYALTTDIFFQANKDYYMKKGDSYVKVSVVIGMPVAANTYYEKFKVEIPDWTGGAHPLYYAPQGFYDCIVTVLNKTGVNTVLAGEPSESTEDRVFLPSLTEVSGEANSYDTGTGMIMEIFENSRLKLFEDKDYWARRSTLGVNTAWWLRSGILTDAQKIRQVNVSKEIVEVPHPTSEGGRPSAGVTFMVVIG